jgi:hypothetical protein
VNSSLGGLFTNLGDNAGNDEMNTMKPTFEAISIQTFKLKDCEFDFFSEAPAYLDTVSVKDSAEATYKFKINVGKIEKVGYYSFYDYVISEWTKNVRTPSNIALDSGIYSQPYFEPYNKKPIERGEGTPSFTTFSAYRESIFPQWRTQSEAYQEAERSADKLRNKPLENALGRLLKNSAPYLNQELNNWLGDMTGGILGTAPLGNVYGQRSFIQNAAAQLNDFLTPGNQMPDNQSAGVVTQTLNKGILTGATGTQETLPKDTLEKAKIDRTLRKKNVFNYGGLESANGVQQDPNNTTI